MGEAQGTLFPAEFNRSVRIEARPERLSADAGALLMRDLTDRLGLPALVRRYIASTRVSDTVLMSGNLSARPMRANGTAGPHR